MKSGRREVTLPGPLTHDSACRLLERLRRREISSRELVGAFFERIDALNGRLNAFVHDFRPKALNRAEKADEALGRDEWWGPLHGLPVTVKESIDTAGIPTTLGIEGRAWTEAAQDAVVVRAARSAGAILMGKTNVPQTLASPMYTNNPIWGATLNPWAPTHGPGGSSGGEAAALAAGLSVLGIGSDVGGSVRIPAAFCGVCALKPTAHRWSNRGSSTMVSGQKAVVSQTGPMARTAEDVALLFRALDPVYQSRLDPRVPPIPLDDPASMEIEGLRIGFYEGDGFFTPAASGCRAVREAVEILDDHGIETFPYRPSGSRELAYQLFAIATADGGTSFNEALRREEVIPAVKRTLRVNNLPSFVRRALQLMFQVRGEQRLAGLVNALGRKKVEDLWRISARLEELRAEEMDRWRERKMDAIVCPAHATTAAPLGAAEDFTLAFSFTARYNLLDMPAGVVPVTRVRTGEARGDRTGDRFERIAGEIEARSAGLPVGIQIVGRPWQEQTVLAIMRAVQESARGRPDYPATPVRMPADPGVGNC